MPDPTPLFVFPGLLVYDGQASPFGWVVSTAAAPSPPSSDFFTSFFSSFFDIA